MNLSPLLQASPVILVHTTAAVLALVVGAARKHNVAKHKSDMTKIYILALIVTGLFTLAPGRIMYRVFFET